MRQARWISGSVAVGVLGAGIAVALTVTTPSEASSSVGGTISRNEVIERAQAWVDQRVPYSQETFYTDGNGTYRQDCSGFVSMAWHLSSSRTTLTLPAVATRITIADLRQGDALDIPDPEIDIRHVILFAGWTNKATGAFEYYEEPDYGMVAQKVSANINATKLSGHLTKDYVPYRYNNVVNDQRIGVLATDGHLYVKGGDLSAAWVDEYAGARSAAMSGKRIGVLGTDGHLYVKEGGLDAEWIDVRAGVQSFALSGDRIGVLANDGHLYVREGGLDVTGGWVDEASGVLGFALSGNRIGVIVNLGQLLVKEGGLSASWGTQFSGAQSFTLSGHRIGVLSGGHLYVKAGLLTASWVDEYAGATAFALTADRIGVLANGHVYVKEGGLSASWVDEYAGATGLALSENRVAVLAGGHAYVNEGSLSASWVDEYAPATTVLLPQG